MLSSLFRAKPKASLQKKRPTKKRETRHELLRIDGQLLPVKVRLNPRAGRMIVKVNPATGEVSVTAPRRAGLAAALDFVQAQQVWIAGQLARALVPVPLLPGATIPFHGVPHEIRVAPKKGPAPVWCDDGVIWVAGAAAHAPRRVLDFLKSQARAACAERAMTLAARLDTLPSRITVRDTQSRWGSCSTGRALSFSWRLILAPDFVLDYVVAHEVAHLKEMNHGQHFWAHVKSLVADKSAPQAWLTRHGRELQRYGRN